ncbi:MAG: hypothetical protein H0U01_02925 [Acidimicrobiia bacterium]|nr:hypothetical protein [Acidimicrobiia bacterium]
MNDIEGWISGRLPDEWSDGDGAVEITVDREEILVVLPLASPSVEGDTDARRAASAGRITRFREETRADRMRIADEAEARFGRKVAWGATCDDGTEVFTSLAVPVMTRLRQPERAVLDTLVEAGIARSRSEALAWSVRLVGQHQADWIAELRAALVAVHEARAAGPA